MLGRRSIRARPWHLWHGREPLRGNKQITLSRHGKYAILFCVMNSSRTFRAPNGFDVRVVFMRRRRAPFYGFAMGPWLFLFFSRFLVRTRRSFSQAGGVLFFSMKNNTTFSCFCTSQVLFETRGGIHARFFARTIKFMRCWGHLSSLSQRPTHSGSIFRLLLKIAVGLPRSCDSRNFCRASALTN